MSRTTLDIALEYIAEGRSPVPIPFRSKSPGFDGWIKLRITADTANKYFNGAPQNIGVILGSASNEEVDIDLDCTEAIAIAPHILPPTRTFGRASKPRSHWIYRVSPKAGRLKQFRDPDNSMIVEYRADGGQTVYPGSTHESGETIEWADDSPVATVDGTELRLAVARVAAAVLLVRAGLPVPEAVAIVTAQNPPIAPHQEALGKGYSRISTWLGLTVSTTTPVQDSAADPDRAFDRCRSYVSKIDGAVSGQGGHAQTFHVAQVAARGFGLSRSDTLAILREYNTRCTPPWSDRELEHKAKQAETKGEMGMGSLLNAARPEPPRRQDLAPPPGRFDDDWPEDAPDYEPVIDDPPEPPEPPVIDHDVQTGEVRSPLQRVSQVVEGVDDRFVVPPGFRIARAELVKISQPKHKLCPACNKPCPLGSLTCPKCDTELPDEAPETVDTIARAAIWIGAELVRTADEGNLLDVVSVVSKRQRHVVVPRALLHDPRKLAQLIEGAGVPLKTSKNVPFLLATYLSEFLAANRAVLPHKAARIQFGWDDKCQTFLLGKTCVGASNVVFYSQGNPALDRLATWLSASGDLGIWRDTAQEFLAEAPTAALMLSVAVSSPMLRLFGWSPIGAGLAALGGGGKTAQLHLAASVWGFHGEPSSRQGGGIIGNGNATLMALLGQFLAMPDLPHLVDELKIDLRDRGGVEASLHQLVDGVERARMRRDGRGTQGNRIAPGSSVIATETALEEFLKKGGVVRRYMPLQGPYGGARRLGEHVPALCRHYGHAGAALVAALVAATPERRKELARRHEVNLALLRGGLSSSELGNETLRTWCDQMAVCLASADVACELCPDVFPDHETWTNQLLAVWASLVGLVETEAHTTDVALAAYEAAVDWVISNRARIYPKSGAPRNPIQNVIGKVRVARYEDTEDEELAVVDVLSSQLSDFLASKGYSVKTLARDWIERGYVQLGQGTKVFHSRNCTVVARVGGIRTSVYRLVCDPTAVLPGVMTADPGGLS